MSSGDKSERAPDTRNTSRKHLSDDNQDRAIEVLYQLLSVDQPRGQVATDAGRPVSGSEPRSTEGAGGTRGGDKSVAEPARGVEVRSASPIIPTPGTAPAKQTTLDLPPASTDPLSEQAARQITPTLEEVLQLWEQGQSAPDVDRGQDPSGVYDRDIISSPRYPLQDRIGLPGDARAARWITLSLICVVAIGTAGFFAGVFSPRDSVIIARVHENADPQLHKADTSGKEVPKTTEPGLVVDRPPAAKPEGVAVVMPVPPTGPAPAQTPAPIPAPAPQETVNLTVPTEVRQTNPPAADTATLSITTVEQPPGAQRRPNIEPSTLVSRGDALLISGDIPSARLIYQYGADAGDGVSALRLGESFDPGFLQKARLNRAAANLERAIYWYGRARELGNADAATFLDAMQSARR